MFFINDFTLINHKFKEGIEIIPIGDVHLGSLEHCKKEWEAFCKYIEDNKNVYIILVGDLINNATRNSVSNVFEDTMRPMQQKILMCQYLKPIKDRILCAVAGNHEQRSGKDADDDPMYDIMAKLDLEDLYRENAAFLKISCGERASGKTNSAYTFCVTHGAGGGTAGSVVNRNEKFGCNIEGLDCLIVGHSHKGTVSKPSKIVIDPYNNMVTVKDYVVISSVSWLNYGGYALRKMLSPSQVANPQRLMLSGSKHKKIEVRW